mmetsp:Transcript_78621/g.188641  ORF Transcript_78621/g.188641 Transcript_78621/m.188641 type:complete len:244 (-) Transcript_78621:685-1416(-)
MGNLLLLASRARWTRLRAMHRAKCLRAARTARAGQLHLLWAGTGPENAQLRALLLPLGISLGECHCSRTLRSFLHRLGRLDPLLVICALRHHDLLGHSGRPDRHRHLLEGQRPVRQPGKALLQVPFDGRLLTGVGMLLEEDTSISSFHCANRQARGAHGEAAVTVPGGAAEAGAEGGLQLRRHGRGEHMLRAALRQVAAQQGLLVLAAIAAQLLPQGAPLLSCLQAFPVFGAQLIFGEAARTR